MAYENPIKRLVRISVELVDGTEVKMSQGADGMIRVEAPKGALTKRKSRQMAGVFDACNEAIESMVYY